MADSFQSGAKLAADSTSPHRWRPQWEIWKEGNMMTKKPLFRILLLVLLLPAAVIGSILVVKSPRIFASDKRIFSQKDLVQDAEQLKDIIERTHPDPYIRGGGKIGFHRNYQVILDSIPEHGLDRDEFARLLRPFVASVNDGHTLLEGAYTVDRLYPGGVPLLFGVVEESLYVAGVAGEENRKLIGSLLLSVEGVHLEELIVRQKQWQGIENQYHALEFLSAQSLLYAPYMQDLLPEWRNRGQVRVELQLPTGEIEEFAFDLPISADTLYLTESQVTLPVPGESGFLYDFTDQEKQIAYLRIDHMSRYRELYERRKDSIAENYPSVTEMFTDLVVEMKAAGSDMLIVDLRECVGGNSVMADILVYHLYGKEMLQYVKGAAYAAGGGSVLKTPPKSKNRAYDFSWDFSDDAGRFRELSPQIPALLEEFARGMPTFYAEFETGRHAGYYTPEQVVVLVSPKTFSSGFVLARYLYLTGAMLIGTPSGQAITWYCDPIHVNLRNTDIKVAVSTSYCNHLLPDEPQMVEALPVHHPMTYTELRSYKFDPNAEVLYALELLPD
jgi:hypothetical protein